MCCLLLEGIHTVALIEYSVPMYICLGSNMFLDIQVQYILWYVWDSHHPQE